MKLNRFDHLLHPKEKSRYCEHPGCDQLGEFRAPRTRHQLRESDPSYLQSYLWFCEEHVRSYNLKWNYYEGMNDEEVMRHRYSDLCWQRPTHPMGRGFHKQRVQDNIRSFEGYRLFFEEQIADHPDDAHTISFPVYSESARALRILGLSQPITIEAIKKAYKELVKKYHPDSNGGCSETEEKLKKINQAYNILKKTFKANSP